MRILFVKLLLPVTTVAILYEPFVGVLFFILIAFVRLEVLTWNMVDARFALITSVLTLVSWLVHIREKRQHAERIPGQYWLMLIVIAMMSISTLGAEASVDASWNSNVKFYKYAVFLFLMIQMINNEKRLRLVQEVMFWGVNFLVLWGFDQHFRGNDRLEQVGGGDFSDSSGLAALFNLMFPMVVYRVYHTSRWVRYTGMFFAPLYLIDMTFTQSRSGFLGIAASLLIIFARAKHKLRYVAAAVPIALILSIFMPSSFLDRMGTIDSGTKDGEKRERSADERLKVWAVAVAVFKDHPVIGVGRGNFGLIHSQYAYPIWYGRIDDDLYDDLFNRYRVCHNIFLDLLVSNGLMTFIPWCLLMISVPYTLARIRKRLRVTQMDQYWRFQTYAIEIGVLAYLITGAFQDLAEVEAFYWVVMLAGITRNVLEVRVREAIARGELMEQDFPATYVAPAEPRANVPGIVAPVGPNGPVNKWHE